MDIDTVSTDVDKINESFACLDPVGRIKLAYEIFGDSLVLTTSGGSTSFILPKLMKEAGLNLPIIFVDTGYYTTSTYEHIGKLMEAGFDVRIYSAAMSKAMQEALYGQRWMDSQKKFEEFRAQIKHEPLSRAFEELKAKAWLRGVMHFQNEERSQFPFAREKNGMIQLHPILDWTPRIVKDFTLRNKLPQNHSHFDITKQNGECKIGDNCGVKWD